MDYYCKHCSIFWRWNKIVFCFHVSKRKFFRWILIHCLRPINVVLINYSVVIKCSSVHLEVCVNNEKYIPKKKSAVNEYVTGIFYSNLSKKSTNFCAVTGVKKSKFSTCFQMSKSIQSKSFESNCSTISFGHDVSWRLN